MAVTFATGTPAAPQRLFKVHAVPLRDPYISSYDVTTDGQRFLTKVPVHDVTSSPIHVLSNWLQREKR
jgi:hypothetical protein